MGNNNHKSAQEKQDAEDWISYVNELNKRKQLTKAIQQQYKELCPRCKCRQEYHLGRYNYITIDQVHTI